MSFLVERRGLDRPGGVSWICKHAKIEIFDLRFGRGEAIIKTILEFLRRPGMTCWAGFISGRLPS
jgi:hypothetical protein